jgi:hypothetical protein
MRAKTSSIETEEATIVVVPHKGWRTLAYYGACLIAMVTDGSFIGTDPPYDVQIRDKSDGKVLYRERGYFGGEAAAAAQLFKDGMARFGLNDFIFRRSHGWRADS